MLASHSFFVTLTLAMRNKKNISAFTLLELIIVIIVIGVLASLAVPRMLKMLDIAKSVEAFTQISAMRKAIEACLIQELPSDADHYNYNSDCFKHIDALPGISDPNKNPSRNFNYEVTVLGFNQGQYKGQYGAYYGIKATLVGSQDDMGLGELQKSGRCSTFYSEGGAVEIFYGINAKHIRCGYGIYSSMSEDPDFCYNIEDQFPRWP